MDRLVNRTAQMTQNSALPTIQVDVRGIIRVNPGQFHTAIELSAHFSNLSAFFAKLRQRGDKVRVLVDLRGGNVLSPEASKVVQDRSAAIYRSEDRLAILVDSHLVKMQARRVVGGPSMRHFAIVEDAELWLMTPETTNTIAPPGTLRSNGE